MVDTVTKKALLEFAKREIGEKVKLDGKEDVAERLGIEFVDGTYDEEQREYETRETKAEEDEMTGEIIGIVLVDNGVRIEIILTGNGIRYAFEDVGDLEEYGGEGGETELYKSKHSVIGMAEERGYHVPHFNLMGAVRTLAIVKVRDTLDVSFDKAKAILED